jgi:YegS/Rv2252/BmrU family lipid kinase
MVQIRRVLLIVNPAARRGSRLRRKSLDAFAALGIHCDVKLTEAPGHAAELARNHSGYDALFTLGGDGTAMEVLGALAPSGPPVGILAGGTANVIARTLRIPLRPGKAIPKLINGDEARIDLGRLGDGRRFAIGVGVGLDAAMIEGAPATLKQRFGFFAYVISGYRAVLKLEKFDLRLTVDDEIFEMSASAALVVNFGAVLNNLLQFGDGIRYDDGLLNACVFSPTNFWDSIRILSYMVRKKFPSDPCLFYKSGKEFVIETLPGRIAQADGELLARTPHRVSVEPLAARLLIPTKVGSGKIR